MATATLASPVSIAPAAAHGAKSEVLLCGNDAVAATAGDDSHATAQGFEAVAVAAGRRARATLLEGDRAEAVAAAGRFCVAETFDSFAYLAAVGIAARAISHVKECPAVAVGHEPHAIAPAEGIAVAIGYDPIAQAGVGGILVFIDTASSGGPYAERFQVGVKNPIVSCPGLLLPDTPYTWSGGMKWPEVWEDDEA